MVAVQLLGGVLEGSQVLRSLQLGDGVLELGVASDASLL